MRRAWGLGEPPRNRPPRVREGLRLSPSEERYILAETATGQVYAAPSATRVQGQDIIAEEALAAIQATCDNHEARRSGFEAGPDGTFTKYVEARATVRLEQRAMPGASDRELIEAVNAYCLRKGDLSPGELHRFILIEVGPKDYVFGMALHHATSDALTLQAFGIEVLARTLGNPFPEAKAQYSDFWDFDWKGSDAYRDARAFWLDRAAAVAEMAAWAPDRAGGAAEVRPGEAVVLSPETLARTRAAAEAIGVTHFSFFYAAYLVLLSRMTGSSAVCTTFQSAGRRAFPGAQGAHGVFSNALMLAMSVDETRSIAELATGVRQEVKRAISHEIYPLHHLIRETGLHPRYAINWLPESQPVVLEDVRFTQLPFDQNQDDDDLNLRFITRGDEVRLVIYFNPASFSAERVAAATRQLADLAHELAGDVHRPIGEVPSADIAPPGVLPDLNASLPEGGEARIFDAFLDRAAAAPEALAVKSAAGDLTYADLERRSRDLAGALAAAGVEPGDRVAILAERGHSLVCSMLAAARLGAPFVVLDPAYPEPRLAAYLEICAPQAIVRGAVDLAPVAERLAGRTGIPVVEGSASAPPPPAMDSAAPDAIAYLLFTSGSTGQPRCVACSHQPLTRFVAWQAREFDLSRDDRFTLLSGLSHDPLLRDIFTPLSIGAAVMIPGVDPAGDPPALATWLNREAPTVAHLTPQLGRLLAAGVGPRDGVRSLRRIFWGGDMLPASVVRTFERLAPEAEQINFYGATETPQAAGFRRLGPAGDEIAMPVGRGVDGVQLLVLGPDRRLLGIGELGEVAVRSNFLPLGDVDAGRLHPPRDRSADPAGRANIHHTGDRGLYLPDGSVLLTGRGDDQAKVRGHRVHLAEVTAALQAMPGVTSALALAVGDGDACSIVGFVTPRGAVASETAFAAALAGRLPAHMVPARIAPLDALPLLPNGKPDRAALLAGLAPASDQAAPRATAEAARSPTEAALMDAWSSILGGQAITPGSTFASLGGDSLSYVRGYLATEEVLGEAPAGWHQITVAELAATKRAEASGWSHIDMPILLRVAAILLVVAGHFEVFEYGGGATNALMVVSGFMLGGMALPEAFSGRTGAPILRVVRNIFVPTALLSLALWIFRSHGEPAEAYILLFTADLQNYDETRNAQDLYLWYVHCLLHIMLMLYGAILALKAAKAFGIGQRTFLIGLFVLGCLGRFVLPVFLDPGFYTPGVRHMTMLYFLPTTHFATIVLGAWIAGAGDDRERRLLLPILLGYVALTAWCYGPAHAAFLLVGGGLLLGLPRLAIPRFVAPVVFSVAGASLWIYLTHMMTRDLLKTFDAPWSTAPAMIFSVAAGVAVWMVWTRAADLIRRLLRRPAPTVDATV